MNGKVLIIGAALAASCPGEALAEHRPANFDESKVAPYAPPEDPLAFADGRKLASPGEWPERRAEILEIFQREMYGRMPAPSPVFLKTFETGETMDGFAVREQIEMTFRPDGTGPKINWLVMRPRYAAESVPAIMLLNYHGNQTVVTDREVPLMSSWSNAGVDDPKCVDGNYLTEASRGLRCDPNGKTVAPIGMILARGYAVVTACYCEISPDPYGKELQDKIAYTGVFELWGGRDNARTDNTTALMAWAWTLSRGLDMLEKNPAIDAKRVVVTGFSRLGKAALLAGAYDERFAVVVPNQTGGGGVPLARRDFGETVGSETETFTHWYCKAYSKYADNEGALFFDQHLLVAAVAPRPMLVEGFDRAWFDAKGEYLSCRAAAPVWKFLGKDTMPDVPFPDDFSLSAVGGDFGYVRRPGSHGINYCDWTWMMDFADRAFNLKGGR